MPHAIHWIGMRCFAMGMWTLMSSYLGASGSIRFMFFCSLFSNEFLLLSSWNRYPLQDLIYQINVDDVFFRIHCRFYVLLFANVSCKVLINYCDYKKIWQRMTFWFNSMFNDNEKVIFNLGFVEKRVFTIYHFLSHSIKYGLQVSLPVVQF